MPCSPQTSARKSRHLPRAAISQLLLLSACSFSRPMCNPRHKTLDQTKAPHCYLPSQPHSLPRSCQVLGGVLRDLGLHAFKSGSSNARNSCNLVLSFSPPSFRPTKPAKPQLPSSPDPPPTREHRQHHQRHGDHPQREGDPRHGPVVRRPLASLGFEFRSPEGITGDPCDPFWDLKAQIASHRFLQSFFFFLRGFPREKNTC